MSLRHVHVKHDFTLPVEDVFAYLSEHEHLGLLFRTTVTRLRSGAGHRNGVGSARRIGPAGPLGFEETVVDFVPAELIRYRISSRSPLRDHVGTMRFSARAGGGSQLAYQIQFGSRVPGLARIVAAMLKRSIPAGLRRVEERAVAYAGQG